MKQRELKEHMIQHNFFKDCSGLFLFLLTYLVISLQICGVYIIPLVENSFQNLNTNLFYFTSLMAILSHLKASFGDPGKITKKYNPAMIWLYIKNNTKSIIMANELNNFSKDFPKEDDNKSESSDTDKTEYEKVTSVSEETVKKLVFDYKVDIKRCSKCYVIRLPKTQHCSACKG